jgi:hypothetical protein
MLWEKDKRAFIATHFRAEAGGVVDRDTAEKVQTRGF